MQTLEGPEIAVKTLLEKIKNDLRHRRLTFLMETPISERSFGNWSMVSKGSRRKPRLMSAVIMTQTISH